MMRFYLQKIGFYLAALWAALTINFVLPRLMPGNPVDIMLARLSARGSVAPEARRAIELMLGMDTDQSIVGQYVAYLGNVARGDFGVSVTVFPQTVADTIADTLPWTIALMGIATVISFVLGVVLGQFAGWKRGSWLDKLIPVTTMFQSVPYFWLALVLLYLFGSVWQVFPLNGGYDVYETTPGWNGEFIASAIYYGTLPALTIVLSSVAGWMLGMRNMMVSTLSEDYVVTAEAKGLHPRRIMTTYAARNAILPSLAGFAISLGFIVAGSIVAEQVFSYPGIGMTLLSAVQNNDYALMQGIFLVITLSVLGANLLVDLLYSLIDPRTRARA
ncbi:ABC transporter permease [Pseudonocardia nigra]|uniref:ABC transporter permease n=1 Tax=Pseudonocardia nigra TaxID=1921578 RepID=UPI001FE70DB4|nr:ABC transporter permease [Pseudonocardia nigra]